LRKPVILFYPPSTGVHADVASFETETTVSLHKGCSFTTLLPPPVRIADGSITWNASVHKRIGGSEKSSALITVAGRDHGYLFWECAGMGGEAISSLVGTESVVKNVSSSYLLEGIDQYEDWCHVMLGTLGLGVREQDDFITFWAKYIVEGGGVVVAHVVPEPDIKECADLTVSVHAGDKEVSVNIYRVYVTMVVCKSLSGALYEQRDKLRKWVVGTKELELPEELQKTFPMKYDPTVMTVVEWGGAVINI